MSWATLIYFNSGNTSYNVAIEDVFLFVDSNNVGNCTIALPSGGIFGNGIEVKKRKHYSNDIITFVTDNANCFIDSANNFVMNSFFDSVSFIMGDDGNYYIQNLEANLLNYVTLGGLANTLTSFPSIIGSTLKSAQASNISSSNIATTNATGTYRANYYLSCTNAGSNGIVSAIISFIDGGVLKKYTSSNLLLTNTQNTLQGSFLINADSNTVISYSTVVANSANNPYYNLSVVLEKVI